MIWKVTSLLVLLAVTSMGGAFYATTQMTAIGGQYEGLVTGPARAALELANASRFLTATEKAVYQNASASSDVDNQAANQARLDAIAGFDGKVDQAKALAPGFAGQIDAYKASFHAALNDACGDTIKMAND